LLGRHTPHEARSKMLRWTKFIADSSAPVNLHPPGAAKAPKVVAAPGLTYVGAGRYLYHILGPPPSLWTPQEQRLTSSVKAPTGQPRGSQRVFRAEGRAEKG
jgi:hypothetical protein